MKASPTNPKPQTPHTPGIDPALESLHGGVHGDRLVLVMVGLPARGKTYLARRISRYLSFFHGCPTRIFNLSDFRREQEGQVPHSYFAANEPAVAKRNTLHSRLVDTMVEYLLEDDKLGRVAILDATNTLRERRMETAKRLRNEGIKVVFIESLCNDPEVIDENIRKTKLSSPDYKGMDPEEAVKDYKARIDHLSRTYESIDESLESYPFVKVHDGGRKVELCGIHGFLPSRIAQFVMNVRFSGNSTFYLSRHGQSEYNQLGKIGGDSNLTPLGDKYATALALFVEETVCKGKEGEPIKARLWTSSMQRTIQTGRFIKHNLIDTPSSMSVQMRHRTWRVLDEIYAGVCDGMTYAEIKEKYPGEFGDRKSNKLTYRYPRGESYIDLIGRLEALVQDMERIKEPLIIIGHQAVLRVLYCYFMDKPREDAPSTPIPLHTVLKLELDTYTCREQKFELLPEEECNNLEPPSH